MNQENLKPANPNDHIEHIAHEIESIISAQYNALGYSKKLNADWQKAGIRWVESTSITKVLSESLKLPKSAVVDILANNTEGLSVDEELRVAISKGLELVGPGFEDGLLAEVNNRLRNSK